MASSPDNDEMKQNFQMFHARQARREGVIMSEPVVEPPLANPPDQTWRIWSGQQCTRQPIRAERLRHRRDTRRCGGHEEGLRRTRGEAAGEELGTYLDKRLIVNVGTQLESLRPFWSKQICVRSMTLVGGGVSVVVRGRESRPHGEGRQCARRSSTERSGGRR